MGERRSAHWTTQNHISQLWENIVESEKIPVESTDADNYFRSGHFSPSYGF